MRPKPEPLTNLFSACLCRQRLNSLGVRYGMATGTATTSLVEMDKRRKLGCVWHIKLLVTASYWSSRQRRQRKRQSRFDRVVFVQYGSNGDYPHIHFLAKSPLPKQKFCVLLNAAWSSMYAASAGPKSNEITPILNQARTTGYGLNEFFELGSRTYDHRLSNINLPPLHPSARDDAVDRLKKLSTPTNMLKAFIEFPNHVQAAQARMDKRDRFAAAAMLR